jgi:hypothetical protein
LISIRASNEFISKKINIITVLFEIINLVDNKSSNGFEINFNSINTENESATNKRKNNENLTFLKLKLEVNVFVQIFIDLYQFASA